MNYIQSIEHEKAYAILREWDANMCGINYIQCIKHALEDLLSSSMWFKYLISSNRLPYILVPGSTGFDVIIVVNFIGRRDIVSLRLLWCEP